MVARSPERGPEVDEQLGALASRSGEVDGSPEKGDSRLDVSAIAGGSSGRRDEADGAVGERSADRSVVPQLDSIAVRLLEVVGSDQVVAAGVVGRAAFQPVREALVQARPFGLRDRVVRGVPDEDVAELVGLAGGGLGVLGPDQLLAHEAQQRAPDLPSQRLGRELGHGRLLEDPADDARPLGDGALVGAEASRRAASSAPIEGGMRTPASSSAACHVPSAVSRRKPSSTRIPSNSST